MIASLAERLTTGAAASETGCIVWKRSLNSRGYGLISVAGKAKLTHRVAWELKHGPIAEAMTVDHLCLNKRCINTEHMEIVTRSENSRRAPHPTPSQPRCPAGHHRVGGNSVSIVADCTVCTRRAEWRGSGARWSA